MDIILFNPLSNNGKSIKMLNKFVKKKENYQIVDITKNKLKDIEFCNEDIFTIIGGDGSLHTLCNEFKENNIDNEVYLLVGGTGNDFSRDFKGRYINVTKHFKNAPISNNNYYLTSTGFGVDGEVCDNVNKSNESYYKVTINTMKKFKTFNLRLKVDGKEYNFSNVWFASVMNGRCIGGGMKLSPKSNRLDDKLEIYVIYNVKLFKLLRIFPTIFLGIHGIFKKNIFSICGKDITMESDVAQVMHSDGEIYGKVNVITAKL